MQFPELTYPFPIDTVKLANDHTIAYSDQGRGEKTLLFIHGLASYMPAWIKNTEYLKDRFRCITFDLPGYGKSSGGVHSCKVEFYSECIIQLIQALNLKNVILVGHSMGGHIAINTALDYGDMFSELILLAPAGPERFTYEEGDFIKRVFTAESLINAGEFQIRAGFYNNFHSVAADIEFQINDRMLMSRAANYESWCNVVAGSLYGLLNHPVADRLNEIKQRTLMVFGRNDKFIPHPVLHRETTTETIASAAAAEMPNCRLEMINECGHFLQFEKPEQINRLINDFLL